MEVPLGTSIRADCIWMVGLSKNVGYNEKKGYNNYPLYLGTTPGTNSPRNQ